MRSSTRAAALATAGIAVAIAATITVIALQNQQPATDPGTGAVVDTGPRILAEGSTGITLVEFADFECPSCAAFAPILKELRAEFAGEITFAFRHFPLPQHAHAVEAAIAAEAAGRQDLFVEMQDALFTSQQQWAGSDDPSDTFRGLAEQIGLDLTQYDADILDPSLRETVEADAAAGAAAGVRSTPTFFLDGEPVPLQEYSDLRDALVAATAD